MNKIWLKAATIRAVRSFAQGALAALGTGAVFTTVDWLTVLSTAALAALVSVLMSLAGLPEAKPDIMAGAGETFDLCGADRPGKCVGSIAEIMEGMGIGNIAPPSPNDNTPDGGTPNAGTPDSGAVNVEIPDTGVPNDSPPDDKSPDNTPDDEAPPAAAAPSHGKEEASDDGEAV